MAAHLSYIWSTTLLVWLLLVCDFCAVVIRGIAQFLNGLSDINSSYG